MEVGDRVFMKPETFGNGFDRPDTHNHTAKSIRPPVPPMPGMVTYINRKRRWFQVTFDIGIKECFPLEEGQ